MVSRVDCRKISSIAVLIIFAPALAGCVGAAVGAGASVATAASEERGLNTAARDLAIRTRINALWLQHDDTLIAKADISISEGRVLLTGVVPTEKLRGDAVRLSWQASGVKEVINEIEVFKSESASDLARDGWISATLKTRLTLDKQVTSINYSIDTVNRTVYLIGIAQSPSELERVRNHARQIKYVRRIVSHVIMKDDPRRKARPAKK
ncbi:MAG: phospholipid-binding domain-containing protein [Rhodospirillaceae bacterium]|nr:phospholipid-binding domain-containing protein [Rhodospirillaceae bacterium]|tara:strand:- start:4984 stop:5610 length:627 start_codon:yes stop_codon:yes gene_type:complete